jgi:hypothetical protein
MERPDGVKSQILRGHPRRASNAGNKTKMIAGNTIFFYQMIDGVQGIVQGLADAASGAKNCGKPVSASAGLFQIFQHGVFHSSIPFD